MFEHVKEEDHGKCSLILEVFEGTPMNPLVDPRNSCPELQIRLDPANFPEALQSLKEQARATTDIQ